MENRDTVRGHLSAIITIFIWGTTFISIKLLLVDFTPVEIMFFRLVLSFIVLLVISPHVIKYKSIQEELLFAAAGLCGVTLYFIFQNTALTYSLASNVSVLISVAPFFTAIFSRLILKDEELHANFFVGFAVSMIGIILISFNGNFILKLNPLGDLLAILSAVVWALYSIAMRKIGARKYNPIQSTRRVFFYGLLFLIPVLGLFDFKWDLYRFNNLPNVLNILFLGMAASALCYVAWNFAVSVLGAVRTSVYIYAIPIVTIVASALLLGERITGIAALGVVLILAGLYISERKSRAATQKG